MRKKHAAHTTNQVEMSAELTIEHPKQTNQSTTTDMQYSRGRQSIDYDDL